MNPWLREERAIGFRNHFLPEQLSPSNPGMHIQVPSNPLHIPCEGLVQSSGHVSSPIVFTESVAVQTWNIGTDFFLQNHGFHQRKITFFMIGLVVSFGSTSSGVQVC